MPQGSGQSTIEQRPDLIEQAGPPRMYYGWVMLPLATLASIATSPAQTYGVSAFNDSFRETLGLSHSQLTGAYMAGTFLASLPMSYVGSLMDRYGLRVTVGITSVLFGAVCMLTSQVHGLLTLFLSFFCLRLLGQGALGLLSGNTLAFWFDKRLGTVEGLRHLGIAGAIATVPALNLWLIHSVGWRWAYAILGLSIWAVMLPVVLWLWRDRPEQVGQHKDGLSAHKARQVANTTQQEAVTSLTLREAMRTHAFWIGMTCHGLWAMLVTAVFFNAQPFFASRQLDASDAAWLFTIFAGSLAVMHVIAGMMADRLPLNLMLSAAMLGLFGSMVMAWQIDTFIGVWVLGVLMGISQGLIVAALSPFWPRYFGTTHLGKIRGLSATVLVAGSSLGPFCMGLGFDLLGSYDAVMLIFAVLPLPLILLALLATMPPLRRRRLDALSF